MTMPMAVPILRLVARAISRLAMVVWAARSWASCGHGVGGSSVMTGRTWGGNARLLLWDTPTVPAMHHWRVVLRDGAAERATGRRLEQTQYAPIAMKSQRAARVHSGLMGRHATV